MALSPPTFPLFIYRLLQLIRTGPNCNEKSGPQRGSSGFTFSPSNTFTGLGSGKGKLTSLWTPRILDTNCLGFYLQVSATETTSWGNNGWGGNMSSWFVVWEDTPGPVVVVSGSMYGSLAVVFIPPFTPSFSLRTLLFPHTFKGHAFLPTLGK